MSKLLDTDTKSPTGAATQIGGVKTTSAPVLLHPTASGSTTPQYQIPCPSTSLGLESTLYSPINKNSPQILMPRLPSSDSLNYSTGPGSPGKLFT